jgi:23S rRNA pseudouridine1911/1915/1917 synthase
MRSANYNQPAHPPAEALPASAAGPIHRLTLPSSASGLRFDQALAQALPDYSRNRLKGWIEAGRATLDERVVAPTHRVRGGEAVALATTLDPHETPHAAQAMALTIVHEDDTLIVVDKPAGLVVHPGSGNWEGTLLNALLHHAPELAAVPRAGIVHRLDKDTSGLLVVARTLVAQTDLVRQLAARTVKREYVAIAAGDIAQGGTIDAPIGRHPAKRTTMAVVSTGRPARTHIDVIARYGIATQVRCRLETGRTHQIRVHLAARGHPLIGDPAYGRKGPIAFGRQALHAARLGLVHPRTQQARQWSSPLPADLVQLIEMLAARHSASASR